MGGYSSRIDVRVDNKIKELIERYAHERQISVSKLVIDVLLKEFVKNDYGIMSAREVEYAELRSTERKTSVVKYVRSKSAERLMFIHNIRRQALLFTLNKKDLNREELLRNMKLNYEIAQVNGWVEELPKIQEFIIAIEAQYYELDQSTKLLELVKQDEKTP